MRQPFARASPSSTDGHADASSARRKGQSRTEAAPATDAESRSKKIRSDSPCLRGPWITRFTYLFRLIRPSNDPDPVAEFVTKSIASLVQRFIAPSDGTSLDPETVVVSTAGGTAPRWRDAGGKELYFIAPDGTVMAAEVSTSGERLSIGVPRALFRLMGSHGDWDVVSDGSRFLIAIPAGADASAPFTILWNRLAQLPRRAG